MIVVVISGGIGSQLFQYAAAYNLAKKTKSKIILDICFFNNLKSIPGKPNLSPNLFKFDKVIDIEDSKIVKNIWVSRLIRLYFRLLSLITFGKLNYERIDIKNPFEFEEFPKAKNYFINGYPNNLNYVEGIMDEFLSKFITKNDDQNKKVKVGIHIRRADFTGNDLDVCGKNYYEEAIKEFYRLKKINPSEVEFLVFCQEEDWPKKNIDLAESNVKYIIGDHISAVDDFKEMCNCDHLIMPNSSFSWWSANKITSNKEALIICPDLWWDKIDVNKINIYPKNWMVLSTNIKPRNYVPK